MHSLISSLFRSNGTTAILYHSVLGVIRPNVRHKALLPMRLIGWLMIIITILIGAISTDINATRELSTILHHLLSLRGTGILIRICDLPLLFSGNIVCIRAQSSITAMQRILNPITGRICRVHSMMFGESAMQPIITPMLPLSTTGKLLMITGLLQRLTDKSIGTVSIGLTSRPERIETTRSITFRLNTITMQQLHSHLF